MKKIRLLLVKLGLVSLFGIACVQSLIAQTATTLATTSQILNQLTESAWQRHADYLNRDSQLALIHAKEQINKRLTPENGAIDISTSRASQGGRGYELAYTTPLWLINERSLSTKNLQADSQQLDAKLLASKLRVAGQVREAYWAWQNTSNDARFAQLHADNSTQLLNDVKKRLSAGDMAAADVTQAEVARFISLAALTEAKHAEQLALLQLQLLVGAQTIQASQPYGSRENLRTNTTEALESHPHIAGLDTKIAALTTAKQLALIQAKARNELTVGASRDRGASGETYQSTLRVGVKLPFGNAANQMVVTATADAQINELRIERELELKRLANELTNHQARLKNADQLLSLAQQRASAAQSLLEMVQKAFAMGEFDLPTRIRTVAEANESQRLVAKALIEQATAVSAYKQASGLLP